MIKILWYAKSYMIFLTTNTAVSALNLPYAAFKQ
jgi:hypothetical protein